MDTDTLEMDAKALAAARRRARQKERAARRLPGRDDMFAEMSLPDLQEGLARLRREETLAQYWRRLLQRRIGGEPLPGDYTAVWVTAMDAPRRLADLPGHGGHPGFPDLLELWRRQVKPTDVVAALQHLRDLHEASDALAGFHDHVKIRIDLMFTEVLVRYQEEPTLALLCLAPALGTTR